MILPITAQMIVKNEDRWIWYAIKSIIDHVSYILIFDTGSQDNTVEIIKSFSTHKIKFEQKGTVNPKQLVKLRQEQLERTKTDWFLLVDGDEVWPENSIKKLVNSISKNQAKVGVVVKAKICLGDIFHYQDDKAGRYRIGERLGHYNIRAYRKIKGYYWQGIYPNEAYVDGKNLPIQEKKTDLIFLDNYYWHLRHLPRSTKFKNIKRKFEFGKPIAGKDIPEVFSLKRPSIVSSPLVSYSIEEKLAALVLTPLRVIKRTLS